jgi:hypothetical protein
VQQIRISGLPWNVIPGDLKQSLCRVLKLPSMAFVHISNSQFVSMDDFADLINHARDSTGLSLDYINTLRLPRRPLETKHGEDNKQTLERHHISHLACLNIRKSSVFVDWLLGPQPHLDVSHIHTLHTSLPGTEDDSFNRLLHAIGSSLQHVFIALPYACE